LYNFQTYLEDSGIAENLKKNHEALLLDPARAKTTMAAIREIYRMYQEARAVLYIWQWYQHDFHQAFEKVRAMIGGNKIGKTLAALMEIYWGLTGNYPPMYPKQLRIPQPAKIHLGVSDFKDIGGDVWIPMMEDWFPQFDNPRIWKKSKRKQVIDTYFKYLKTGSELFILSDKMDVSSFEGWWSDLFVFDEPFQERKYSSIHRGLLARRGRFIFVGTPLVLAAWTKREFIDKSNIGDRPDGKTYCIKPSMDDNRYQTAEEIDDFLSRMPEDERETRRYGTPHHLSRLVWETMANRLPDYFIPSRDVDPSWTQIVAIDPHPRAPWAGLYYMIGPEGLPVIFDELYESKMILGPFAKLIIARELEKFHGCRTPDRKILDHWCNKPDNKTGKSYGEMFADAKYPNFTYYEVFPGSVDAHRELCKNRALDIELNIPSDSWFVKSGILKPGPYCGPGILIMDRCMQLKHSIQNLTFKDQKRRSDDNDPSKNEVESLAHLTDAWKMIEAARPYFIDRGRMAGMQKGSGGQGKKKYRHKVSVKAARRRR